ncbi:trypsin-like peptidase domain-containing protein [Dehalococcoidia bacterium]|nr:trypsin-like peptidase domain-containing protein [Dehalococcoidia bacterium]MCL0076965.1 trypsin-like peptidase domain-containing protein [Dehalococcoidia bacterium]
MIRCRHFFPAVVLVLLLMLAFTACIAPGERTTTSPGNGILDDVVERATQPGTHPAPAASFTAIDISNAIADVVEQVMPAVVFISAHRTIVDLFGNPSMHIGTGSGVIISPDGYILTNNHVVEGADRLEVTLHDGRTLEAALTGTDPLTDLAVINIEGRNLPTAPFGDATQLRPGNLVIAIGNPLGLEGGPTITLGVVSNTERSFTLGETTFYDVIQTDAAINPGNSGGPLVDLRGQVVGINTVLIGGAENIGFAISTSTAQPVSQSLIAPPHRVIRPWLGVLLSTVTPAVAAEHRLVRTSGVLVARLVDGSPAAKAGMREGDVITHFEGEEVTEATQLIKALWRHQVGERVEVTFWRGEEEKKVVVELTVERP